DRPRGRRREAGDEDSDDRPRNRRRDDDDEEAEERPRRRRTKGRKDRATLRSIAILQKGITACLGVYVLGGLFVTCLIPPELRWLWALVLLAIVIGSGVAALLLAIKVFDPPIGVFLCLLTLAPFAGVIAPLFGIIGICVSLLILLIISGKATSVLKEHGIR